ncbi:hypothetical protein CEXT_642281, partial [Caerostris extrusa]
MKFIKIDDENYDDFNEYQELAMHYVKRRDKLLVAREEQNLSMDKRPL